MNKHRPEFNDEDIPGESHLSEEFPHPQPIDCPSRSDLMSLAEHPMNADPSISEHLFYWRNRYVHRAANMRMCLRSLRNASSINPGFNTQHVIAATLNPGSLGYSETQVRTFYEQLSDHVRTLPGVMAASFTDHLPLGPAREQTAILDPMRPEDNVRFSRDSGSSSTSEARMVPARQISNAMRVRKY